ncbi:MAG: M3 family metallopeptidase [Gammaproteobacteria bacterium]|nr:M3 family metallopeptidase [Gammaproteobacteria bacterium]
MQSWQRRYIQSKVSRERFGVDSREVRRYFDYDSTRDGLFELVQDLFGVRIEPVTAPVWHEDVEAFELREGDRTLGRFYLDMHPRDGKFQHAAMFPFVVGIEGRQLPVAALVCNFPRGDEPMQFSQVETFLHEFGHLLHFQFAGHQPWSNVSGISTEWDFVEAPSQMLEEWIWDHDTVSRFARNAAGEPLPADLHAAMVAERDFGLGMGTRGQLAYAKISLSMHDRDPDEIDFDALYDGIIEDMTRFESLPGTHRWASFGHLNGYSAIYYTYQWSLAIATDLFTRFREAGLRDRAVAAEYRKRILEPGGSRPADQLVADFLGREVRFEPYAGRGSGQPPGRFRRERADGRRRRLNRTPMRIPRIDDNGETHDHSHHHRGHRGPGSGRLGDPRRLRRHPGGRAGHGRGRGG